MQFQNLGKARYIGTVRKKIELCGTHALLQVFQVSALLSLGNNNILHHDVLCVRILSTKPWPKTNLSGSVNVE